MSKQDKQEAIAIATAQKIAQNQKTQWRQIDAATKKAKKEEIRSKLIEIRRIAFRDAVREVCGNGYYKD